MKKLQGNILDERDGSALQEEMLAADAAGIEAVFFIIDEALGPWEFSTDGFSVRVGAEAHAAICRAYVEITGESPLTPYKAGEMN